MDEQMVLLALLCLLCGLSRRREGEGGRERGREEAVMRFSE